ncbi:shikimate dehydrogenase [Ancylobacter sonchi]
MKRRAGCHSLRVTLSHRSFAMSHNFLQPLTGSFAMPAAENPTVAMVEAAYRHHGLDWRYINCEVAPEALGDAVRGARAMGWRGFNCSIPHKVAVIEHLDGLGESAQIIGAVNTIVRRGDELIGENTDGKGFVKALSDVVDPTGKTVVLFGAGGAARAVGVELALAGAARISVVNRGRARGEEVAGLLNARTRAEADYIAWEGTFKVPVGTDIVINATSIGLFPKVEETLDLDTDTLMPTMVVADGIHNPPLTRLLKAAQARGCRTVDGLGMLVGQGVIGIKYWTGIDADPAVMRQALLDLKL